ncbi:hypothetical protein X975_13274, partial [Stegodyphus mimosarum]
LDIKSLLDTTRRKSRHKIYVKTFRLVLKTSNINIVFKISFQIHVCTKLR